MKIQMIIKVPSTFRWVDLPEKAIAQLKNNKGKTTGSRLWNTRNYLDYKLVYLSVDATPSQIRNFITFYELDWTVLAAVRGYVTDEETGITRPNMILKPNKAAIMLFQRRRITYDENGNPIGEVAPTNFEVGHFQGRPRMVV